MTRKQKIGCWTVLFLGVAGAAHAQSKCVLDGKAYEENVVVCVGGLVNVCSNGTWQGNDGARCDGPSGSYVGSRRPFDERNPEPVPDFYKERYPDLNLQ